MRASGIAGISTASLRHGAANFRDSCRSVSTRTPHYGIVRNRKPPLQPTPLLWSGSAFPDRGLNGDDRSRRRSGRQHHRRASHLVGGPALRDKAAIDTPTQAMDNLLGNAVRFDLARDVLAAGEGIETMLSLRCVMPTMPMVAALSAAHLAAILFPATLRRLYIARDDDPAGDGAMASLIDRANEAGIEAMALSPRLGDFNEDLRTPGIDALRAALRVQIVPEDVARFMELAA